jgi:hypothetical protein
MFLYALLLVVGEHRYEIFWFKSGEKTLPARRFACPCIPTGISSYRERFSLFSYIFVDF